MIYLYFGVSVYFYSSVYILILIKMMSSDFDPSRMSLLKKMGSLLFKESKDLKEAQEGFVKLVLGIFDAVKES